MQTVKGSQDTPTNALQGLLASESNKDRNPTAKGSHSQSPPHISANQERVGSRGEVPFQVFVIGLNPSIRDKHRHRMAILEGAKDKLANPCHQDGGKTGND